MQKTVSMKKQERNERKKKKLAALATVVELNDNDKYVRSHRARTASLAESSNHSNSSDEGQNDFEPSSNGDSKAVVGDEGEPFQEVGDAGSSSLKSEKDCKDISPAGRKRKPTKSFSEAIEGSERKRKPLTSGSDSVGESENSSPKDEEERLDRVKTILRNRKLVAKLNFRLKEVGMKALIQVPQNQRVPIFLTDIQHLLMAALIGKSSPCLPNRWLAIEDFNSIKNTIVLMLDGCSLFHYLEHEKKFERINQIFDHKLEMVMPPYKPNAMIDEMLKVPLTNLQAGELISEHGSLEAALEMIKDPTLIINRIFNIRSEEQDWDEHAVHPEDKFPRTKLLLSALQLVDEGYPMPLSGEFENQYRNYLMTSDQYEPVTNRSPLFGVDCEMCRTSAGVNELTRISIVNEKLQTVYETLVRPANPIVDYLTKFSGITKELMDPVTKTLQEVQKDVRALLPPDAILVGQSLQSDLHAMQMMHPYVIDTSVIFNISGERKRKSKLQKLALTFLKESIQENEYGHDSIEDSIATMKLVKLKLANNIHFGDQILADRKRYQDILRSCKERIIQNDLLAFMARADRTTAIVSSSPIASSLKSSFEKYQNETCSKVVHHYEVESNSEVVQKARELVTEHNLVIANLKVNELEFRVEKSEETAHQIDKWVSKVWKSINPAALVVVLMGGSSECPNGLAKIAVKHGQK